MKLTKQNLRTNLTNKWMSPLLIIVSSLLFVSAAAQKADTSNQVELSEINFEKNSIKLTSLAKKQLDSSLLIITKQVLCKVEVLGGAWGCELCAQRVWDRVNAVVTYLVARGLSKNRIIFNFGGDHEERLVVVQFSNDDGPSMIPPPHPGIRKHYSKTKEVYLDGHVLPLE